MGRLNEIYDEFKDRVEFVCVYIQEAHPTDGWQVLMNVRDEILHAQAKTEAERAEAAGACLIGLQFRMPMVLDKLSNEVDEAYSALPERLYVLGPDGTIAWRCGPGPFGFDVDGWKAAIEEQASQG